MSQSTELKLSRNDMLDKMKNQIVNEIEEGLRCLLAWKINSMGQIVEIIKESEA
jgi:hypothetical protein